MPEQDAARTLRLLAATRPQVRLTTPSRNAAVKSELGIVGLTLPHWQLTLAGVTPRIRATLAAADPGNLQLMASGRYGRHWWIEVAGAEAEPLTILATHLRLHLRRDEGPKPTSGFPYNSPAEVTVTTARPASSEAARSTSAEKPQSWSPAGSSKI